MIKTQDIPRESPLTISKFHLVYQTEKIALGQKHHSSDIASLAETHETGLYTQRAASNTVSLSIP